MAHFRMLLYGAALAMLLPAAACSSNGRVAMSGAGGIDPGGRQAEDPNPEGPNQPPQQPTQPAALIQTVEDTTGDVIAAAGNLGLPGEGDLDDAIGGASGSLNSIARVSVSDEDVIGEGAGGGQNTSPLGVSVASNTQNQGSDITLGVLSNGQVATAQTPALSGGQGDLIGATADGDQIIGEGNQQTIGVGLLTPANSSGDAASANVLSGGQVANVQVNGTSLTPGNAVVDEVTDTVTDLLDGGG